MIVVVALVVLLLGSAVLAGICDRLPWQDPEYDPTDRFSNELGAIRRAVRSSR